MDKKTFYKYKDRQKPLALEFFLEQANNGVIRPNPAETFSMGFEAGVSFALNLVSDYVEKMPDDNGTEDQKTS